MIRLAAAMLLVPALAHADAPATDATLAPTWVGTAPARRVPPTVAQADEPTPPPEPTSSPEPTTSAQTPTPTTTPVATSRASPTPTVDIAAAQTEPTNGAARPRLLLELEVYAQARDLRRSGADAIAEFALDRGELGATIALGDSADAELRLETIRSAADGGALGIAGDSTVVRVKVASVGGRHAFGNATLGGSLGFVRDPWIEALQQDYTLLPLTRVASERLLGWPVSDLSARVDASVGPVRASLSVGNGEGLSYPERNSGKTTTAVLGVTAIDTHDVRLVAAGVARDGSIGAGAIRDRRFGGGVTSVSPWARGGVELVKAYGIGDRGDATGLALGGWIDGRLYDAGAWRLFASARGSTLHFDAGGGRESTFGGALSIEPWHRAQDNRERSGRGNLRIWLALDRETTSGMAMPLPGADAGDATSFMLIASTIAPFEVK